MQHIYHCEISHFPFVRAHAIPALSVTDARSKLLTAIKQLATLSQSTNTPIADDDLVCNGDILTDYSELSERAIEGNSAQQLPFTKTVSASARQPLTMRLVFSSISPSVALLRMIG
jgi:hypothetical protein